MSDQEVLQVPAIVATLAHQAKGNPIAWWLKAESVVIVFEDGRKLTFERTVAGIEEVKAEQPAAPLPERKEAPRSHPKKEIKK